jgi:hypothetical protein
MERATSGGTELRRIAVLEKKKMAQNKLTWSNLGPIRIDMALDHVPKHAGVYKLTFKLWGNTYSYIGEAGARGLRARIGDYANHPPAEGNKVEHMAMQALAAIIADPVY